jgi:hypothetical protein
MSARGRVKTGRRVEPMERIFCQIASEAVKFTGGIGFERRKNAAGVDAGVTIAVNSSSHPARDATVPRHCIYAP